MFFWFVCSFICFTVAITLITQSIVIPMMAAFLLYLFLNLWEKVNGENNNDVVHTRDISDRNVADR